MRTSSSENILPSLCVVMPIYNESESIEKTFLEWKGAFESQDFFGQIHLLMMNDGSKDNTIEIIKRLEIAYPQWIKVIDKSNSGHGNTCLQGYRYSFDCGYDYTMQLDSDGQCDPKYFVEFLQLLKQGNSVVYGFRYYRKDGFLRFMVSRVLSVVAFMRIGLWLWDPNVPYRVFKTKTLGAFLPICTDDFFLVNVLLALYHKRVGMKHVMIVFRDRHGGSPSLSTFKMYEHGKNFYRQLGGMVPILKRI